jgi:hypothetical protein
VFGVCQLDTFKELIALLVELEITSSGRDLVLMLLRHVSIGDISRENGLK